MTEGKKAKKLGMCQVVVEEKRGEKVLTKFRCLTAMTRQDAPFPRNMHYDHDDHDALIDSVLCFFRGGL